MADPWEDLLDFGKGISVEGARMRLVVCRFFNQRQTKSGLGSEGQSVTA